jgi:hypothetical protein
MTIDELREIGSANVLHDDHLRALWHQQHGNWDTAHGIVQKMDDEHAEWIHALLHREEGDLGNARYWYARCGRPYPGEIPYEAEVSAILAELPE